ncbi:DNA-3-methyladenine glycosylase 2 family protein, partial [Rhodobacterales bacterium HKCCSP123]|nr:DNA-3-methyladenine glycosylase 2 family protein [Rhodobacterales bacterium HKCCSP123]
MRVPERIETEADLRDGAAVLVARDARFAPILSAAGPL